MGGEDWHRVGKHWHVLLMIINDWETSHWEGERGGPRKRGTHMGMIITSMYDLMLKSKLLFFNNYVTYHNHPSYEAHLR